MWQKLSLRARLNSLFALLLLLGLAINIGQLVMEAGPRVNAEDESVVRLSREFIETLVVDLKDLPDPEIRLSRLLDGLKQLRHVSITREGETIGTKTAPASRDNISGSEPPAWFVTLVQPNQKKISVPVTFDGRAFGSIEIASNPRDEISEIWNGIISQVQIGTALAVALLLITMAVVDRALAPIQSLSGAMARIEAGDYATRTAPAGSPELAEICDKLNHLAFTLGAVVDDKRLLAERIVSLQDTERKEIARELHDEFGPYLFAVRAHTMSLLRMADAPKPDFDALRKHGKTLIDQVNALQKFNRRVLERLRPVGLSELGLREALGALMGLWREAHPGTDIELEMPETVNEIGETAELTIYRVVQEALTNAFRHAGATRINVMIRAAQINGDGINGRAALVQVRDNGSGLSSDYKPGLGLVGMRERIMALGGTMNVTSTTGGGVAVEALVPYGGSAA